MTNIVHISTVHPPMDQRIFHRECMSLCEAGYSVKLIAFGNIEPSCDQIDFVSLGPRKEKSPGLHLTDRLRRTSAAFRVAAEVDADLYHIHDPELIPVAVKLRRRLRKPIVYDCHEDFVGFAKQKYYLPYPIRHGLARYMAYLERRVVTAFDGIITADKGMQEHFQRLGANCCEVVHNFPRLDLFEQPAENIQKKYDLVYHGSIPRYHLEVCFAIDDELTRRGRLPKWLFLGRVPDKEWAQSEVARRGAENRFEFHPRIPHEKVAEKIVTARMGIIPLPDLPKFQRNIPTKLFEFMALRMPVVLSDLPPSRSFVEDERCARLVDPNSQVGYADAIEELLDDPILCRRMGEEGRRRVVDVYNWDRAFENQKSVYHRVLGDRVS